MTNDTDRIERDVQAAVAGGVAEVREEVRRITLEALSGGRLDTDALGRVMRSVVEGAQRGTVALGERGRQPLSEAMKGLDEALAVAAEATELALREAATRTGDFSRQELQRTLEDLAGLEKQFIDTMRNAATDASGLAAGTLHDLVAHARNSGTHVGARVEASLGQLRAAVGNLAKAQFEAGAQGLRAGGALLAGMASGFLAAIAERLQPDDSPGSDTTPPQSPD